MKIKEIRPVLEKFAALYARGGEVAKADSLRVLSENLARFDAKTVKMFAKQHREKATQAKSANKKA